MKPLADIRVLDCGIITAGAGTSGILADLGATVIKVESPSFRDPFRRWNAISKESSETQHAPYFRATNRNKKSISIDLKSDKGREAFLRLVGKCDVVVENFRRGVLHRLQIDYQALRQANPDIVLCSVTSQGETGPEAAGTSYGSTLEAVGGLSWHTGYRGGAPVVSGINLNYPDQVATVFSAGMVCVALFARANGGGSVHLDISQRELASFLSGDMLMADAMPNPRLGNWRAPHRIQECFLCKEGTWIAVTVNDDNFLSLLDILYPAAEGGDGRAAMVEDDTAAVEAKLREWAGKRSSTDAVEALVGARIAAAPVMNGHEIVADADPHWDFALARLPDGGVLKGFPFQMGSGLLAVQSDAPLLGADTADILKELAGYSSGEIADLKERGVIELAQPASPDQ